MRIVVLEVSRRWPQLAGAAVGTGICTLCHGGSRCPCPALCSLLTSAWQEAADGDVPSTSSIPYNFLLLLDLEKQTSREMSSHLE